MQLNRDFFARDACLVARELLGKVIRKKYRNHWLSAQIIETEAYYRNEKGSHSSLGFTEKRRAMFMPAGTIYMYYSRGGDSLNISCGDEGDAVLIKSAIPFIDTLSPQKTLSIMQRLNPMPDGRQRPTMKLLSGQTLLCKSLQVRVPDWDQKPFDPLAFYIDDVGYVPEKTVITTRLGIPAGRDEHLEYRFIDYDYVRYSTRNPVTRRNWKNGLQYHIL